MKPDETQPTNSWYITYIRENRQKTTNERHLKQTTQSGSDKEAKNKHNIQITN